MKKRILKAIQLYRDLDAKASAIAANMSSGDPLYVAADYAGMLANVYIYKFINYIENKLQQNEVRCR